MKLRIKEAIREQGFTIQEVATKIGKSKQTLHGIIEKGNPTINTLSEIAGAISVPISRLYEEESDFIALINYEGRLYKAYSIDALEEVIRQIKPEH